MINGFFNIQGALQYERYGIVIIINPDLIQKNKFSNQSGSTFLSLLNFMKRFLQISVLLYIIQYSSLQAQVTASGSVLATGKWFRIAVTEDGIYRIPYSKLKQLGLENPSYPMIYGNNAGPLSYLNDNTAPDDLRQLSVWITGNDDKLDDGEYLLFYARGTGRWIYNSVDKDYYHSKHNYSDTAFYFLTSGASPGRLVSREAVPSEPATYSTSASDALFVYEKDQENLIKSGRDWFQRISSLSIDPGLTDLITEEGLRYRMRVAARSEVSSGFILYEGTTSERTIITDPVDLSDATGTYASITDSSGHIGLDTGTPAYTIKFDNNGQQGAYGWLDYLELKGRKSNIFKGKTSFLSDAASVAPGRITETTVTCQSGDMIIWDVTDPFSVMNVTPAISGQEYKFMFSSDSLRTFAIFSYDQAAIPDINSNPLENQDLHGSSPADMIIVTHPLFISYAKKLAGFHSTHDGITSLTVTPQQIYNEFSGGIPDICAIRNFIRMKYMNQKGTGHPLKYLLLFGDGSYENRTPPPGNPNFIPTYQSKNSNIYTSSFTSDDFYGLLEQGEGESEGTEDIGIGRLPVNDTVEAGAILNKIFMYNDSSYTGAWRNDVCLTADDEDGNIHMADAEGLDVILHDSVPFINTHKIYLDAYKEVTSSSGQSYPDVNKAINDRINEGCLIFNYTGHGNESGLAHERVVKSDDINSWKNKGRLPLFITATCEFSRFDDMDINIISGSMTEKTSAGEMVLLNKDGGGIALMSTTRLVYSAPNYTLNRNILGCAFDRDGTGNPLGLGDIIRIAKNRTGDGPNKRNFTLLGDPALKLAWPWHGTVITDSVNSKPVSGPHDTLSALSVVTVSGHVEHLQGIQAGNFNGVVSPVVFDKQTELKTLANDGGDILEFNQFSNIIFSGKTQAKDGKFRFTFIVPHDIDYSFGNGRISYYGAEGNEDVTGYFSDITVGGFSGSTGSDNQGPSIKLYMNDTLFRNGGLTDEYPALLAYIEDTSGINTTGSAIGHNLELYLDNDLSDPVILNSYFENDFDSYTSGKIYYGLGPLEKGKHTVTLKAWDNYNNSSEADLAFTVEDNDRFILRNLINYPNPFTAETRITAGHNRPDEEIDVIINIYSMDGRLLKVIKSTVPASGYTFPPVIWDGTVERGEKAGKGVYPYSITARTTSGEIARAAGKMIIL